MQIEEMCSWASAIVDAVLLAYFLEIIPGNRCAWRKKKVSMSKDFQKTLRWRLGDLRIFCWLMYFRSLSDEAIIWIHYLKTEPSFCGRLHRTHFGKCYLSSLPYMGHFLLCDLGTHIHHVFPGSSLFSKPDLCKYLIPYKTWQAFLEKKSTTTSSFP